MGESEIRSVDLVVGTVLGVALLRGVFLGLIREAFSIAALGGACVAARLFTPTAADWLVEATGGEITATVAPWIAGVVLAIATIAIVATVGKFLRRGARAAGLGWADRAGGALLGVAEGALVATIGLVIAVATLGRDHPLIADSRSMTALDQLERIALEPEGGQNAVASPPQSL